MVHKVARVGDHGTGICTQHGGSTAVTVTFVSGAPNHYLDGQHVMRVGDTGIASCGHSTQATTGSNILFADGLAVHIQGSSGIIVGGGTYTVDTNTSTMDTIS